MKSPSKSREEILRGGSNDLDALKKAHNVPSPWPRTGPQGFLDPLCYALSLLVLLPGQCDPHIFSFRLHIQGLRSPVCFVYSYILSAWNLGTRRVLINRVKE